MKKKITKLCLEELEQRMEKIPQGEMHSIVGGKEINMDRNGIVISTTDNYQGWTYINIVEPNHFGGYNSFSVVNTWSTEGEINRSYGIVYDRYTGNGTSEELFMFLCNYTNVEWGMHTSDYEGYYPIIETTHGNRELYPGHYEGYQGNYHNHEEDPSPSDSDMNLKDIYTNHYGYEYFYIYYEKDGINYKY